MDRKELLARVKSLPDDGRPFAVAIWHRPHVIQYAKEQGVELTAAQADEAVRILSRRSDAETSFNFDGLAAFFDDLKDREASKFVATAKLIDLLQREASNGAIIRLLDVIRDVDAEIAKHPALKIELREAQATLLDAAGYDRAAYVKWVDDGEVVSRDDE